MTISTCSIFYTLSWIKAYRLKKKLTEIGPLVSENSKFKILKKKKSEFSIPQKNEINWSP